MTLLEKQLAEGRVYARLAVRRRKLEFAREGIAAMRALAPASYLSLSFGKQSICLAHLLSQVEPQMQMYFLASGESWILHNYAEVIEQFTARFPINLHIVQTDHVFDGRHLDWQASRDAGQFDLQNMCRREDWQGWYWGLVKDESGGRRATLSQQWRTAPHPTIYRYADGRYRCCPLANWTTLDVAAYIAEFDLPLLRLYHVEGLAARTVARVTRKCAEHNGIAALKHADFEAYNRLVARFPILSAYT